MKRSMRAASNAIDCAKFYSLSHDTVIETRAFPSLARRYPRDFTFYVADATAQLKLVRCPHSLAPPLVTLPSMSLIPQLH